MSTEELMVPRAKIIAPFPSDNGFKVGDILTLSHVGNNASGKVFCYIHEDWTIDNQLEVSKEDVERCVANFQPIPWYANRHIIDLPRYLKWESGSVCEVYYYADSGTICCKDVNADWFDKLYVIKQYQNALPATEQEYNDYINSNHTKTKK